VMEEVERWLATAVLTAAGPDRSAVLAAKRAAGPAAGERGRAGAQEEPRWERS